MVLACGRKKFGHFGADRRKSESINTIPRLHVDGLGGKFCTYVAASGGILFVGSCGLVQQQAASNSSGGSTLVYTPLASSNNLTFVLDVSVNTH